MFRTAFTLCASLLMTTAAQAEVVKMAVTTSFDNSGLADVLLPAIDEALDIQIQLLVVGTGQALRLGEAGDVDAVLVHAKAAEEAFVAAGHATHRREIMYNDFVLIGPDQDPAQVQDVATATEALRAVAATKAAFVSRGDDSGTHKAELGLWAGADLDPAEFAPWYQSVGAGMGAALNTASGLNAYIMSDRASWIKFGNKGDLALLFAGDPALFNQYSFLPISPGTHDHIPAAAIAELENWLTGEDAAALINGYRVEGQQLFTFNAKAP
jgi:tungstate transport system substrate-binding protein